MKDLLLLSLCCLVERQKAQYYVRGLLRVEVVWLFCRVFLAQRRWPGGGGGRQSRRDLSSASFPSTSPNTSAHNSAVEFSIKLI